VLQQLGWVGEDAPGDQDADGQDRQTAQQKAA